MPPARRLRLARFNVETSDEDEHLAIQRAAQSRRGGGRSPASRIMFYTLRNVDYAARWNSARRSITILQSILPFFGVFVALLMVSRIPYPHVVNQIFRGQKSFAHVVAVVFALMVDHAHSRLFDPDHLLRVRLLRPDPLRLAEMDASERERRADVLENNVKISTIFRISWFPVGFV